MGLLYNSLLDANAACVDLVLGGGVNLNRQSIIWNHVFKCFVRIGRRGEDQSMNMEKWARFRESHDEKWISPNNWKYAHASEHDLSPLQAGVMRDWIWSFQVVEDTPIFWILFGVLD